MALQKLWGFLRQIALIGSRRETSNNNLNGWQCDNENDNQIRKQYIIFYEWKDEKRNSENSKLKTHSYPSQSKY